MTRAECTPRPPGQDLKMEAPGKGRTTTKASIMKAFSWMHGGDQHLSPVLDILPLLLPVCGLCYGPSLLGPRRLLRRRPLPCIVPRRPWSFSFYRYPSRFLFLRATGSGSRNGARRSARSKCAASRSASACDGGRRPRAWSELAIVDTLLISLARLMHGYSDVGWKSAGKQDVGHGAMLLLDVVVV